MIGKYALEELDSNPHWVELVDLYESMKKILPAALFIESFDDFIP